MVKRCVYLTLMVFLTLLPGRALATEVVEKTYCDQAFGHGSASVLREYLLTNAKRLAVNELFGEMVVSTTIVDNYVVTSDQILTSSAGFVRIEGNPRYFNGENLAEACVTIRAYLTDEDLNRFRPFSFRNRICVNGSDRVVAELRQFAREEVLIQAMVDYDRGLTNASRSDILRLAKQVIYLESGFLPDTETYCVTASGNLIPIEVMAFVQSMQMTAVETPTPPAPTPSPLRVTQTLKPAATPSPTTHSTPDATATTIALLAWVQATVETMRTAEAEATAEQQKIEVTLTARVPTATPTQDATATAAARETRVQATVEAIRTIEAQAATEQQAIEATLTALAPPTSTPTTMPTPTPIPVSTPEPLRVVYVRGDVGNTDVWVADFYNRSFYPVAEAWCDEAEPAWLPGGRIVVYQANCDGSYDLYQVELAGKRVTRLTNTPMLDEREPDVSPDGQRIAYRVNALSADRNRDGEIWIMGVDGRNQQSLGIRGRSPVWSPDGVKLLFMSERAGTWDIYTYDLRSGQEQQITRCSVSCRWPAWSPDGSYILYHTTTTATSATADTLWYVPASGGAAIRITSGDHSGRGSWSGEGLIIFNSDKGIEYVWPDGSNRTILVAGGAHWAPIWSR